MFVGDGDILRVAAGSGACEAHVMTAAPEPTSTKQSTNNYSSLTSIDVLLVTRSAAAAATTAAVARGMDVVDRPRFFSPTNSGDSGTFSLLAMGGVVLGWEAFSRNSYRFPTTNHTNSVGSTLI